ncbi:MAG: hypothetical protein Q8P28_05290 [Deltaproteobacteria bacterium]|nr:hypothetical protein [Deltaproteobacteria bacterium]
MIKYLILLACTPLLMLILQMIAVRIARLRRAAVSNQLVVLICLVIGHIPMGIAGWFVYLSQLTAASYELTWAVIYGLAVYNALAYSYFHIFNMSETARRIRILYEIYNAKQLKISDIESLYGVDDMLLNRLERLLSMRQIKLSGNRYSLNSRSLYYTAKIIAGWGCILGFPPPQAVYSKAARNIL